MTIISERETTFFYNLKTNNYKGIDQELNKKVFFLENLNDSLVSTIINNKPKMLRKLVKSKHYKSFLEKEDMSFLFILAVNGNYIKAVLLLLPFFNLSKPNNFIEIAFQQGYNELVELIWTNTKDKQYIRNDYPYIYNTMKQHFLKINVNNFD